MIQRTAQSFVGGMNDTAATAVDYAANECALLLNMRPDQTGGVVSRLGTRKTHASALSGLGFRPFLTTFTTSAGVAQIVVATGTAIHYSVDGGVTWTAAATGLTDGHWDSTLWREGGTSYLLLVNGTHAKKWDGASLTDITNIPSGARSIEAVGGRVWIGGHSGNVVAASKVNNCQVWAVPDGISTPVGDGTTVLGVKQGMGGELLVFKNSGEVARVVGNDNGSLVVYAGARAVTRIAGPIHKRTAVALGDGTLAWYSARGVERYDGASVTQIALGLRGFFAAMLPNAFGAGGYVDRPPHAFYHPLRDEYWVFPLEPISGGRLMKGAGYNLKTGACFRIEWASTNASLGSLTMSYYSNGGNQYYGPMGIALSGFVVAAELGAGDHQDSTGANGAAFTISFTGPMWDFGEPVLRKWMRRISMLLGSNGTPSVSAYGVADGTSGTTHAVTLRNSGALAPPTTLAKVGCSARGTQLQAAFTCTTTSRISIGAAQGLASVIHARI